MFQTLFVDSEQKEPSGLEDAVMTGAIAQSSARALVDLLWCYNCRGS